LIRSSRSLISFCLAAAIGALGTLPLAAQVAQYGPDFYGEGFGKNKIAYRNFDWHIYHSPHFNVYYYSAEESLLQKVVSIAESSYDQLSRAFNYQIKEPTPLIFYSTHSAFEQNNVILNFIPEGVGAFASPARFRMVLPVDVPDAQLSKLILHELTHIFQYHILFQGRISERVTAGPPTWFMEGMASYMAKDESTRDKMYLRDAVVNDQIPPVTKVDFGGFFAYRFGHAVFDFIEDRWGKEGFLDFVEETRNTFGGKVDRAIKRAFRIEPDDFDIEFRRWLRRKYLPELVKTGEPSDFGRVYRITEDTRAWVTSPTASPSGDLVAGISNYRGKTDVLLFNAKDRKFLRNLTRAFSNRYQYLVAQEQELGRDLGRDISFSPDGNSIAAFVKRERGRSLMLIDVLHGGIRRVIDMDDIEQQLAPAWSPDGRHIAFAGFRKGQFDIFSIDLDSLAVNNLTNDEVYDGAPTYSPDGKTLVFVSSVGKGFNKIFRLDLDHPGLRYQLTTGDSNENDPIFSPDGKRLYFTSDRDGSENIYSLDLATGDLRQFTNVVTGASMPTLLASKDGKERLVFNGYWKMIFSIYDTPIDQPVKTIPAAEKPVPEPSQAQALPKFEPDIQVTIDPANKEKYRGFKFFLEDASSYVGVDSTQTVLGRVVLSFSDYLGDKRIIANLSSVESFSNFDFIYADLSHRRNWQVEVFDTRTYYLAQNLSGFITRDKAAFSETGAVASLVYPFSFYRRAEIGAGYIVRKIDFQSFAVDLNGNFIPVISARNDNFPIVSGALTGDSAVFAPWGPITGRRWRLEASYAPDTKAHERGTLQSNVDLDFRQYVPLTQRSNLAFRVFLGEAGGNAPTPYFFGGLDTVRGFDFRSLVGDRAGFANLEFRFPMVDLIATPILGFQGIRGVFFLDVGGAYFKNGPPFKFYDSNLHRLQDGVAAYGYGVTVNLFGLDVNWDFAKQWDLKQTKGGYRTSFWIGTRF
jgi:Tol biopolymer transport system component